MVNSLHMPRIGTDKLIAWLGAECISFFTCGLFLLLGKPILPLGQLLCERRGVRKADWGEWEEYSVSIIASGHLSYPPPQNFK